MSKALKDGNQTVLNPTSQMAFAVAACALVAAVIGVIINHWMTGWMAVGGMVGVGLFYLAVGILNLSSAGVPAYEDDDKLNASQRNAKVENLVGEAVSRPRRNLAIAPNSFPSPQMRRESSIQETADSSAQQRRDQ